MRYSQHILCWLVSAVALWSGEFVCAQSKDPPESNKWRTETKWVAEVIGSGGNVDKQLGAYDSYDDAEAACQEWSKANPKDLRLTRTRKSQIRVRDLPPLTPKPQPDNTQLNGAAKPKVAVGEKSGEPSGEEKRYDPRLVGKWKDKNGQGEFELGEKGTVKWTKKGSTPQKGSWFVRESDGRVLINVRNAGIDFVGDVKENSITGKFSNPSAPQQGFKPISLEREIEIDDLKKKYAPTAEDFVGTWTSRYQANGTPYYEILEVRPNGIMNLEWGDTKYDKYVGAKGTFRWSLNGSKIIFEQESMVKGSWEKRFERDIEFLRRKYTR